MAPSTRFFPYKHEDLNLISRTNIISSVVVVCAHYHRAGETETGRTLCLMASQVSFLSEFKASKRACLTNRWTTKPNINFRPLHPCTHTCTYTYMNRHTYT